MDREGLESCLAFVLALITGVAIIAGMLWLGWWLVTR